MALPATSYEGNDIGTGVGGVGTLGNTQVGVRIDSGSSSNTIGGTSASASNLIANNGDDGVDLYEAGAGNRIEGDTIDDNTGDGVSIDDSSNGTVSRCVIDSNTGWGILISDSTGWTLSGNSTANNGLGGVRRIEGNEPGGRPGRGRGTARSGRMTMGGDAGFVPRGHPGRGPRPLRRLRVGRDGCRDGRRGGALRRSIWRASWGSRRLACRFSRWMASYTSWRCTLISIGARDPQPDLIAPDIDHGDDDVIADDDTFVAVAGTAQASFGLLPPAYLRDPRPSLVALPFGTRLARHVAARGGLTPAEGGPTARRSQAVARERRRSGAGQQGRGGGLKPQGVP